MSFKKFNVMKSALPVMWWSNPKAWFTRAFFMEWLHEVFAPSVLKHLQDNNLPKKCLLTIDNAPAHPQALIDDLVGDLSFIKVKFFATKYNSINSTYRPVGDCKI